VPFPGATGRFYHYIGQQSRGKLMQRQRKAREGRRNLSHNPAHKPINITAVIGYQKSMFLAWTATP
jgi:hypothetical protein